MAKYDIKYNVEQKDFTMDIGTSSGSFIIAAKSWKSVNKTPSDEPLKLQHVLCLHGWLDNANSFSLMAPLLCERYPFHIVAYDDAGCGHSEHKAHSAYTVLESVVDMQKVFQVLGWTKGDCILLSHSRGAVVSMLFASAFNERVKKLIMLDAFASYTRPASEGPMALRKGALKYDKYSNRNGRTFGSKEEAAEFLVANYRDSLDLASAHILAERQIIQVGPHAYRFRYDRKMITPSLIQLTEEMTLGYMSNVVCPVLLVLPPTKDSVLRIANRQKIKSRFLALRKNTGDLSRFIQLPEARGHHFHINTPSVGIEPILDFILEEQPIRAKM